MDDWLKSTLQSAEADTVSPSVKESRLISDSLANPAATRLSSALSSDRRELVEVKLRGMRSLFRPKRLLLQKATAASFTPFKLSIDNKKGFIAYYLL